jgi:hypothetical protein
MNPADARQPDVTQTSEPWPGKLAKKYGNNRSDTGIRAVEAMKQYLAGHSPVEVKLLDTFLAV